MKVCRRSSGPGRPEVVQVIDVPRVLRAAERAQAVVEFKVGIRRDRLPKARPWPSSEGQTEQSSSGRS